MFLGKAETQECVSEGECFEGDNTNWRSVAIYIYITLFWLSVRPHMCMSSLGLGLLGCDAVWWWTE